MASLFRNKPKYIWRFSLKFASMRVKEFIKNATMAIG